MGQGGSKETKYFEDFTEKLPSLEGKTVIITGCTSGTGLVAAKAVAKKGVSLLLLLNRESERSQKAEQAVKEAATSKNTKVETIPCDLQSLESVKKAIASVKAKCKQIDVLCNNAGVMALEDYATKDGYDVQMQTNHLSHFLLTAQLFPLLKAAPAARIIHHTSLARSGGPLKPEYFGKNGGDLGGNGNSMFCNGARWERYHQTKLANATFTVALAKKLEGTSVMAVSAAPGLAQTQLQQTTSASGGMSSMWIMRMAQSAEDGTMPLLQACFGPDVENGQLWEPGNGWYGLPSAKPADKNMTDEAQQNMLWTESEKCCGEFKI